jgi:tetratricopeptide (TPR) repeat protein
MQTLLVILIALVAILTLVLGGILAHFLAMAKKGKSAAGIVLKRSDIEDLLFAGDAASARTAASAWRRAQPKNPAAYLLLARAYFQLGELVETKRILDELLDFSPESEFSARPYLERIKETLERNRPRAVE